MLTERLELIAATPDLCEAETRGAEGHWATGLRRCERRRAPGGHAPQR